MVGGISFSSLNLFKKRHYEPKHTDVIDNVWIEQDGEWTIFQSDLNRWIDEHGIIACPVCGSTRDDDTAMIDVHRDSNIIRCKCGDCKTKLCIIVDAPRDDD